MASASATVPLAEPEAHAADVSRTAALFVRQFVRSPRTVGAIWPSSVALARTMLAPIDFQSAQAVVEFGPGTGAFTRQIANGLRPTCRYLGIELNPAFVRTLSLEFPRLTFVEGSVADLPQITTNHAIAHVDAIVCGLPWATLPISLQEAVFAGIDQVLAPGGVFVTFGYYQSLALPGAWTLRHRLRRHFVAMRRSKVVWANVPPAFAYICHKGK